MRKRNIIADSAPVAKSGRAPPDAAPFRDFAPQKGPGFSADSRDARATFTTSVWGGFYNLWPARAQRPSSFPSPRSPLLTGAASAVVDGRTLGIDMVPARSGSLARRARRRLLSDPGKGGLDAAAPHPAGRRKARSSATPGLSSMSPPCGGQKCALPRLRQKSDGRPSPAPRYSLFCEMTCLARVASGALGNLRTSSFKRCLAAAFLLSCRKDMPCFR